MRFFRLKDFLSNDNMSWQKATSSSISELKDDNENIVDLFSNKEIILQTAFCKKSDYDFSFGFIRLIWTYFHLERSWNAVESWKIKFVTLLSLFPDLGESSLNAYCLESTLLFISEDCSIEIATENKLFWLLFEPKFLKKISLLICEHMLSLICNN